MKLFDTVAGVGDTKPQNILVRGTTEDNFVFKITCNVIADTLHLYA